MRGRLTIRACRINQQIAVVAVESILEDPFSIFSMGEVEMHRMFSCGRCPKSDIDQNRAKKTFNDVLNLLEEQLVRTLKVVEGQR